MIPRLDSTGYKAAPAIFISLEGPLAFKVIHGWSIITLYPYYYYPVLQLQYQTQCLLLHTGKLTNRSAHSIR